MEDNRRGGNGRNKRPRISRSSNGAGRSFGEHSERRSYGERSERRPYGENSERRSFSGDRSFGGDRPRRSYGENSERPRRSFGNNSERRSFSGDRSHGSERPRRSYGESSERRSFSGERRGFGGERRGFGGERRGFGDRSRKPFGGTRKPYFRNEDESGISKMIERRPQLNADQYSDNDMVQVPIKEEVRLNKFIANSGICSRREADNFILAGVVTVNGEVVTELGTKVNINTDDIRFNGERLKGETKVYIVMNKPKGFVTTASDPHADKTVMDLLKGCPSRVFPVGRLDKNTTGVLMFTNDGEIAEKLTHPSYDKKKIYQVSLDNKLKREDFEKILSGVELNDGVIAADELEYIEEDDHRKLGIEIHSGKNRIVRRIFESLGYEVKALDRVYFAGLTKKGLKRGEWRYLTEGEINLLRMGAYL